MEDIDALWTFQESVDELKQKLQYMTYEVELTKQKANEEKKKDEEKIKKLVQLVEAAFKERDDAKAQLQKLQQLLAFINNNNNNKPSFDQLIPFSPDTPLFTNSSLTESQSQSHSQSLSHVSSPAMDSLSYPTLHPTSSTCDSANINGFKPKVEATKVMIEPTRVVDEGSLIIEKLGKGRPLPQKGKLLEAVIEAGPLLETLLVAGALPRWRNPPGFVPYHQIPPVNFKGCETVANGSGYLSPDFGTNQPGCLVKGLGNSSVLNCNYGQMLSKPTLTASSGSCFMGGILMPSAFHFDSQTPKRQRIQ